MTSRIKLLEETKRYIQQMNERYHFNPAEIPAHMLGAPASPVDAYTTMMWNNALANHPDRLHHHKPSALEQDDANSETPKV